MITKLVLNNFGAYKGYNELVFDTSMPVSLVLAGNGEGKTTVFNALLWCLYGTVPAGMHKNQLVNQISANDTPHSENIEMSVTITAFLNGDDIILKRESFFSHTAGDIVPIKENVRINSHPCYDDFESVVSRLFPRKLVLFF